MNIVFADINVEMILNESNELSVGKLRPTPSRYIVALTCMLSMDAFLFSSSTTVIKSQVDENMSYVWFATWCQFILLKTKKTQATIVFVKLIPWP